MQRNVEKMQNSPRSGEFRRSSGEFAARKWGNEGGSGGISSDSKFVRARIYFPTFVPSFAPSFGTRPPLQPYNYNIRYHHHPPLPPTTHHHHGRRRVTLLSTELFQQHPGREITPTGSQSPLLHMATVELFFHQLVLRRRSSYAASCHWKMPTAIDDMMGVEWQSKWEYAAEITPR